MRKFCNYLYFSYLFKVLSIKYNYLIYMNIKRMLNF